MKKEEFLNELKARLNGLPKNDIYNRYCFYNEMIEDMISEGKTEEEAVASIGSIDDIVNDIVIDTPLIKLAKEKVKPNRPLKTWEIVLIILGFPLWLPLLITFLTLLFVMFVLIWVFVIVLYSIEIALISSFIGCLVGFFVNLFYGTYDITLLGAGIISLGFALLLSLCLKKVTIATYHLTKKIINKIKLLFIKKEGNN